MLEHSSFLKLCFPPRRVITVEACRTKCTNCNKDYNSSINHCNQFVQSYTGFASVSTRTWIIRMVWDHRNLYVEGHHIKVWFVGQPLECNIWAGGHFSRDCPVCAGSAETVFSLVIWLALVQTHQEGRK